MGSGKTSAATYLSLRYGFQYKRYSQVLQTWCVPEEGRKGLQQLGWGVMAGGLQAELNARLIAGLNRYQSAAIDGLRHRIDLESLSSNFGHSFGMIFIEAGDQVRFARLGNRFATLADFREADSHPVEANIDGLRPLAAAVILNERSLQEMYEQLDAWLISRRYEDQA
ncbi:MAG TPA: hypothetical protein VH639_20325 [Bryobacteraceae bacterium]|jgi:dephospho-CoA kinase